MNIEEVSVEGSIALNAFKTTLRPMSEQYDGAQDIPTVISKGEGVYITDANGNKMIDCVGGLWCVNAGYGRSEIINAMTEQLNRLAYCSTFPGSVNEPSIALSGLICDLAKEEGVSKVFYASNGSDAIENAFKIARQYWKIVGRAEKYKFMSLRGAYHGTHFGGMAANGLGGDFRRSYEPMLSGFISVETYNSYRPIVPGMSAEEQVQLILTLMEREIQYQSPETIAGFIAEPIQGGGGMHTPPSSYWKGLRKLCDKYDILLISDEVVTGFGRTGFMFGARGWEVKPDIMCCGKGISGGYAPLSATLVNQRISDAWELESDHSFLAAGYTHSGNPVSCSAGVAALTIVRDYNLPENAGLVGGYFLEQLKNLISKHETVGDVRGKGLMLCLEMVSDKEKKIAFDYSSDYPKRVSEFCKDHGVWLRQVDNRFIISPPLIFSKDHVDFVVSILDAAFSNVQVK